MAQPLDLIEVLLDPSARVDERDDAAMDLSAYDDRVVLEALGTVACDAGVAEMIQHSAGESIGAIWARVGGRDDALLERMTPAAREAVEAELAGKTI